MKDRFYSPFFHRGSQVQLEGPGLWMLPMEVNIGINNPFQVDHSLFPQFCSIFRSYGFDFFTIDGPVDNDMGHVNSLGSVFLGHRLGQSPESGLC